MHAVCGSMNVDKQKLSVPTGLFRHSPFPGVRCQMTQVDVAKQSAGNAYWGVFPMTRGETPPGLEQEGTWK